MPQRTRTALLRNYVRLRAQARQLLSASLARRIVLLNLLGLLALLYGILYLNPFQAGLIDARVQSLVVQANMFARAAAGTATIDDDSITIDAQRDRALDPDDDVEDSRYMMNPARVAPVIRRLLEPTKLRARVYNKDGLLLLDSRYLYTRPVQDPSRAPNTSRLYGAWRWTLQLLFGMEAPHAVERGNQNGKAFAEVEQALDGKTASLVRKNDQDEVIVYVAVPIIRSKQLVGALALSTPGGDIDNVVYAERMAILRVFLIAALVMTLFSLLLARTLVKPLRALADAANRVRRSIHQRAAIPDFTQRYDEIGRLSGALRAMTDALYHRIDAIEHFAADVAHELKNPLTSLRSAVEVMPRVQKAEDQARLYSIVQHDIKRLDRLITDIAAASRLDAEMQRQNFQTIDLDQLLARLAHFYDEGRTGRSAAIIYENATPAEPARIAGQEGRLGQVFSNLIDNALSFTGDGTVRLRLAREGKVIAVQVDDNGPGIRAEPLTRVFERFFTDRPDTSFGDNSGLGLSIVKQIVEAHGGTITPENRRTAEGVIEGARFTLRFPAL